ncbi:YkoP family protein [Halalkalibacterium ligniniphilum]|uniref:YkoP family protein n=1 Tax=Halalkalibacterium ligniniphilum TaxID=1134413 RepID=UPI00034D1283|nr:hypothetical protein [Halalkalibacterium ligniniphilum]
MRQYLLTLWTFIDPVYFRFTRLTYLRNYHSRDNIFRVRLTSYMGRNVTLADGTQINKHDTLVKIHLHNVKLLNELKHTGNDFKKGKLIYKYVQKSLPDIATYIQEHPDSSRIKGIIGITLLNRATERLGFESVSISHPVYKWFKWASLLPIVLLSTNDMSFKKIIKQPAPRYLFMSKNTLTKRYNPTQDAGLVK